MKKLSTYLKHLGMTQVIWAGVLAAVLAGGWYFVLRPTPVVLNTLTLAPKTFLQQVSVSGKVVAAKDVDLGFTQSGRVAAVYVRVGQVVAAGTVLAAIDSADLRATILQREAALENQQARLASLKAGTRPEEIAVAQSAVTRDTQALIDAIRDAYRASDAAVHNTVDQFISNSRTSPSINFQVSDSNLKSSVESQRLAAETTLTKWADELAGLNTSSNLTTAAAHAQTYLASLVSFLSDTNTVINRGISNLQFPQSTLDAYSAAVGTARSNVNTSVSAVAAAKAALDSSLKTLALKQAGTTLEDIAAQEAQVKAAQADLLSAQAQLTKTLIVAPFSGTITSIDAKVGQIVSSNTPEISMISTGAFQIESYVPEVNIALIKKGDKADVTLDAYGEKLFGASVVSLDPAETVRDGVSTYRAILQFDAQNPLIKSGMTANIAITTLEKENTLSVPLGAVATRDGKKYVSVVTDTGTAEREVSVGEISSLGDIEILSGLSAGESIVLPQP